MFKILYNNTIYKSTENFLNVYMSVCDLYIWKFEWLTQGERLRKKNFFLESQERP